MLVVKCPVMREKYTAFMSNSMSLLVNRTGNKLPLSIINYSLKLKKKN